MGVPLVDNRAVYHLALQLQQLELPSPARYRVPFLVFTEQALDQLWLIWQRELRSPRLNCASW